jgi:hypothetical protein
VDANVSEEYAAYNSTVKIYGVRNRLDGQGACLSETLVSPLQDQTISQSRRPQSKRWYPPTRPDDITIQKTTIETLVSPYKTRRYHNPEDHNRNAGTPYKTRRYHNLEDHNLNAGIPLQDQTISQPRRQSKRWNPPRRIKPLYIK